MDRHNDSHASPGFTTDAPEPALKNDRWVTRLVVMPLLVVAVCVGVAALFTVMVGHAPTTSERLRTIRTGGPNEKWQSAAALVHDLNSRPEQLNDQHFQSEVLAAFRDSEGDDPKVRKFLAQILGRMRLVESVPALTSALKDPTQDQVVAVLLALAQIGSPAAYESVLPYAQQGDANLRKLAFFVLGRIKDDQAIPLLEKGMRDTDFQVRVNAIFALANFDDRRALAELKPLLDRGFLARNGIHGGQSVSAGTAQDDMEPILTNALIVAGHFRDESLRPDIEQLRTSDPNPLVQRAAIEALAQIDQPGR